MSHGEERNQHLQASYDGLRDFVPVDIYDHNIVSTKGLINVLKILQKLTGFGDPTHRRHGHYSFLHVDVKIFWMLLRMLYNYPAMAPLRHDLCLIFGFWHALNYGCIAVWAEYRPTFLAEAFFLIFPDEKLQRRPLQTRSMTFFTWLRLSYPAFRAHLSKSLRIL